MTPYSDRELADGWEFKILRSASGVFEKPERMREILEEESRAGWILVEKFDRNRVRLKRPCQAGTDDRYLDFDVWRTQIGASQTKHEAKVALIVMGVLLVVLNLAAGLGIAIFGPPG